MYNFKEVEKKWKKYWEDNQIFKTDVYDFSKPKYYVLDMFPYPSGKGLHVGHMKGYTASDVIARMKRMQGYNVLHPIGFDAFGLPAEQYAVKTGNNPATFTYQNINNFIVQFKNAGLSFDWSKQIATCDKEYYKWTQWIFEKLYEAGLAKYCDMPVNWCEELGTVLANDEIIDGKSERGGYPVIRKNMKQWTLNIVEYAEKLLDGLNDVNFPASTIETQKNWIGKSVGAEITFKVADSDLSFQVFTTRADTLFGATYCVLAPEHKLVKQIVTPDNKEAVENYITECAKKSDLERTELSTEKTGVFTGAYAVNPVNNEKLPIYIADYVLVTYAFGALMAVPAHDERDYEFAKKFNLPIKQVLVGGDISSNAFVGDGEHINSGFLDGLNKQDATDRMISWLEEHKCGKKTVKYKMREWIFGRQHFWGEPIPIIHMEDGDVKLGIIIVGIVTPATVGASGTVGAVTAVGINPPGAVGALTVIFFSAGVAGGVTVGALTVILPTADGVDTFTLKLPGAVGGVIDGAVTVDIDGTTGLTVPGNAPRFTTGADTFTDTFGLIVGNTGSTGFILAPTSIVSLKTSLSTTTPFPAITLSFPIFPVDFSKLLPFDAP